MKYLYIAVFLIAVFVRVYGLTSFPPSIYWEEAALGYDAYSILQTGKDHHGNPWPVVAFESFGDWKPAGYFYILVPFIAVLGLNEWAVRLPTVLAGLALIIGTARLGRKVGISPLVALAVGAVSPWAVQFSRAGWEVMSASALLVWANYYFLAALQTRKISLKSVLLGIVLFVASMYTYHATRLIVPLQLVGLAAYFIVLHSVSNKKYAVRQYITELQKLITENLVAIIFSIAVFTALTAPLLLSLGESKTSQRFAETSIFSNIEVIEKSNQLQAAAGNTVFAKLLYHRYILFGSEIVKNFSSHFTFEFLFLSGDGNPRHSLQFYGQLYHIEIVFLAVGLYLWVRKRSTLHLYLLFWLLVSIIPASMTTGTPHALRILPGLPVFLLLIATGIEAVSSWMKEQLIQLCEAMKLKKWQRYSGIFVAVIIIGVYFVEFLGFWRYYQVVYPRVASNEWQYGYKQMIQAVTTYQSEHPETPVFITREQGRPAMYYWFYSKTNPQDVQSENATAIKDQGEFLEFKNVKFIDRADQVTAPGLVVSSSKFFENSSKTRPSEELTQIKDLNDTVVWVLYTTK